MLIKSVFVEEGNKLKEFTNKKFFLKKKKKKKKRFLYLIMGAYIYPEQLSSFQKNVFMCFVG
jgi:hypothetical protein